MAGPLDGDLLCAILSRFFNLLLPTYVDGLAAELRRWVVQTSDLICGSPRPYQRRAGHGLLQLFSPAVFPDELVELLNVSVLHLRRAEPSGKLAAFRGGTFSTLHKLLWKTQNRPIITRFWLFTDCANALLLCRLLQVPPEVFTTSTKNPKSENAARLTKFKAWYEDPSTLQDLTKPSLLQFSCNQEERGSRIGASRKAGIVAAYSHGTSADRISCEVRPHS